MQTTTPATTEQPIDTIPMRIKTSDVRRILNDILSGEISMSRGAELFNEIASDYTHVNHHHPLTEDHTVINLDGEDIVANTPAVELLLALNNSGLKTRSHHVEKDYGWVTILMDNIVSLDIRDIYEKDTPRTKYNGKRELLISWTNKRQNNQ